MVNISEGTSPEWLDSLVDDTPGFFDLHLDADHNRSVITLANKATVLVDAVVDLSRRVVDHLDLRSHRGVHPRIGVVDVVPFVPLGSATIHDAVNARDAAATRLSAELDLPCFLYGPLPDGSIRSLPDVRRGAFSTLEPSAGPRHPHPSAGAVAVGAREPLVAWNLWLSGVSLEETRQIAVHVRSKDVRALGFGVSSGTQVSCNLIRPESTTPADIYDAVEAMLTPPARIERAELVGLVPRSALLVVNRSRWAALDLGEDRTIETAARRAGVTLV